MLAGMASTLVSVIIPTQRRPQSLQTAARSVMRQGLPPPYALELVIVDNDEAGSARSVAAALAEEASFPVRYVHEPAPGVANARNAALAAARAGLIAFLDDDEEAPMGWLAELLAVRARFDADAVFGPVRGRAPQGFELHRAYFEDFFSRQGPAETGVTEAFWGCGNSLVRRAALPDPDHPFSAVRNHIGGEDDLMFGEMAAAGARFAWAADAWVWEDPDPRRLSLGYTIPRAFAYGQGPTQKCASRTPPDTSGMLRWMAIGALQAPAFGLLAGLKWLARRPDWPETLDRAARGLGKLLWGKPFKIGFYGLPASLEPARPVRAARLAPNRS
jgi:succinoglycan biosynthesis protein ExoM